MEQDIDKNNNYNYNTNIKFIISLKFNCVITLILLQNFPLIQKESASANSLIISGIIGNMIDRIVRGSVIDFFNFYIFGYDYPVFNIADIFIVVGIILIVIESFWAGDKIDSK